MLLCGTILQKKNPNVKHQGSICLSWAVRVIVFVGTNKEEKQKKNNHNQVQARLPSKSLSTTFSKGAPPLFHHLSLFSFFFWCVCLCGVRLFGCFVVCINVQVKKSCISPLSLVSLYWIFFLFVFFFSFLFQQMDILFCLFPIIPSSLQGTVHPLSRIGPKCTKIVTSCRCRGARPCPHGPSPQHLPVSAP